MDDTRALLLYRCVTTPGYGTRTNLFFNENGVLYDHARLRANLQKHFGSKPQVGGPVANALAAVRTALKDCVRKNVVEIPGLPTMAHARTYVRRNFEAVPVLAFFNDDGSAASLEVMEDMLQCYQPKKVNWTAIALVAIASLFVINSRG